jgi:hypothetical protein
MDEPMIQGGAEGDLRCAFIGLYAAILHGNFKLNGHTVTDSVLNFRSPLDDFAIRAPSNEAHGVLNLVQPA